MLFPSMGPPSPLCPVYAMQAAPCLSRCPRFATSNIFSRVSWKLSPPIFKTVMASILKLQKASIELPNMKRNFSRHYARKSQNRKCIWNSVVCSWSWRKKIPWWLCDLLNYWNRTDKTIEKTDKVSLANSIGKWDLNPFPNISSKRKVRLFLQSNSCQLNGHIKLKWNT